MITSYMNQSLDKKVKDQFKKYLKSFTKLQF